MQEQISGEAVRLATDEITYRASKGEILDVNAQMKIMETYNYMLNAPSVDQRDYYTQDFADENGGPNILSILDVWESFDTLEEKRKYKVLFEREHVRRKGKLTSKDFMKLQQSGHYDYREVDYASLPETDFERSAHIVETDPLPAAETSDEQDSKSDKEIEIAENQAWLRQKEASLQKREYVEMQGKKGEKKTRIRRDRQDYYSDYTPDRYNRVKASRAELEEIAEGFDAYDSFDYSMADENDSQEKLVIRKDKKYYFNLFQKHKWDTHVGLDTEYDERVRLSQLYSTLRSGTINTVSLRDLKSWYKHFETTPDFEEDLDETIDTIDDLYFEEYEDLAPVEVEDAAKQSGSTVEYFNLNTDGKTYTVGIIENVEGVKKRKEIVVKKLTYAHELRKNQIEDRTAPEYGHGEWNDIRDKRKRRKVAMRNGNFN